MAELDPAIASMLFDCVHRRSGVPTRTRVTGRIVEALLDFCFPPHCGACQSPLDPGANKGLCQACSKQIRWIGHDRCLRCGDMVGIGMGPVSDCVSCQPHPPRFVSAAVCAARYEEGAPARELVLALKFGRKSHLARELGKIMALRINQTGLLADASAVFVVPTPLTRESLLERGFNQAEALAFWVARELKLKLETRLLRKIRATRPQAMLSQKQRRENLKGVFACAARVAKRHAGFTALLIDDVITTGNTVSECARTLRDAGIKRVFAASFAHG
jgi:ComF family protein